jgi:hypothetical protein
MKPFAPLQRLKECQERRRQYLKEENIMKIRTKLAILLVAVVLSLAGFGVLAGALSVDKIVAAASPSTEMVVSITG